ncbi:MAG: ankyrin repeat domain-containing protein [Methylacidiphilales bacterium]|nr:ankyrin repeat domain-containing protein [Candidatus Methylacidiphilales bacterium]
MNENLDELLIFAAIRGDMAVIESSISQGANVNALSKGSMTALMMAAGEGYLNVVDFCSNMELMSMREMTLIILLLCTQSNRIILML